LKTSLIRNFELLANEAKQFSFRSVFFKFFLSSILGSIVGIFTGFFTYRYIEPSLLGIWALFTIYEGYATFTRLGVINGLGRELPYLLGKGEADEAKKLASTGLFYSMFSNLILLLALPIVLNDKSIDWNDYNFILSFILILVRLFLSSYTSYLSVTFRTNQSFNHLSNINNILTVFRLISLLFVVYFGFVGLLIREFLLPMIEMGLMHWKRPIRVRPHFSKSDLIKLVKVGSPLFLVSYVFSFIDTLPRLYIIKFGSIEQLGLFSPIIIMLGLAILLPNAISSYMYPKLSFEFGASQDKSKIWRIVLLTSIASLISGFPMFICVYFLADYVYLIFPKYAEVSNYLKIASFGMLFIGYKSSGLSFSVLKSWSYMIFDTLIYLLVSVLSLVLLHAYISDVLKVATLSMVISFGFMYFFTFFLSYRVTHKISQISK
jgi:O-antigen/teichoic acid export membrane protein